jgi:hypothetical protein
MSNEEETFELTTQSIDDWERLTDLMREVRATRDKLKQDIIKALADESGNSLSGWIGVTRVKVVDTKSTVFSITDLREKYGDEWIEDNSRKSNGAAIEIKTMASRNRPVDAFEIPSAIE